MRPLFEKVTVPEGASWSLLHRRLDDGIPFFWHYHPEFELTLTLNSRGQRYIGDSIEAYDDGDLVLLGPNLPHTWCSAERIDRRRPHIALVMWFTEAWAGGVTAALAEMRSVAPMLARAGRGISFSREASAAARPIVEAIPGRAPADRLLRLMEVLSLIAADSGYRLIACPTSDPARGPPGRPSPSPDGGPVAHRCRWRLPPDRRPVVGPGTGRVARPGPGEAL